MDIIAGVRKLLQDLVVLEMEAVKSKQDATQKQLDRFQAEVDKRFDHIDKRFEQQQAAIDKRFDQQQAAFEKRMDLQHDVLVKTVEAFRAEMRSEFMILKAGNQNEVMRQVGPLSERVRALESQKH